MLGFWHYRYHGHTESITSSIADERFDKGSVEVDFDAETIPNLKIFSRTAHFWGMVYILQGAATVDGENFTNPHYVQSDVTIILLPSHYEKK